MTNRWSILFVLFFARTTMAFQFQSVGALTPFLLDSLPVTLVDIGLLIGLYLGPGVIVAIPGGSIAARLGDKRVVGASLAMMLAGVLLMAAAPGWEWLLAGRILSGVGGVVVNVVMTKMLVDWFAGKEIGTAMGIFISSWPIGIALALALLPYLAVAGGLWLAWSGTGAVILAALVMFAVIYRPAEADPGAAPVIATRAVPPPALIVAALIWALYNTALAMVFGFGPLVLTERGLGATSAASVVSLFTLAVGIGVPLGGALSDRIGRDTVIGGSLVATAAALPMLLALPPWAIPATYAATGLVFGLAAGPIMTTPSAVLKPEHRAFGMGVFFALYYAVMMAGPALAGGIADATGRTGSAMVLGAALLAVCAALLVLFRRLERAAGAAA